MEIIELLFKICIVLIQIYIMGIVAFCVITLIPYVWAAMIVGIMLKGVVK